MKRFQGRVVHFDWKRGNGQIRSLWVEGEIFVYVDDIVKDPNRLAYMGEGAIVEFTLERTFRGNKAKNVVELKAGLMPDE